MSENGPVSEEKPKRRWLRWVFRSLIGAVIVLLVLCLLGVVALATGWPQRKAIEIAVSKGLDAKAEVGRVSILGALQISDFRAFKEGVEKPMLDITGLDADYVLWPSDSRYVESIRVDNLAVHLEEPPPGQKAPQEPARKVEKGKKKAGLPISLTPRTAEIANIEIEAVYPALGIDIEGLSVSAAFESSKKQSVELKAAPLKGSYWVGSRDAARSLDGTLEVRYQKDGGKDIVDALQVDVPGLLKVSAKGFVKGGGKGSADITIDEFLAQDVDFSQVDPSALPLPFRFRKLDLSGTRIQGALDLPKLTLKMPETRVNVVAEGLALGPPGQELYEGDLSIRGAGEPDDALKLNLEATFNRGQTVGASFWGKLLELQGRISLEAWSYEDMVAVTPKNARVLLASVPTLQGLESTVVDLKFQIPYILTKATLKPLFGMTGGPTETAEVTADLKASALALYLGGPQEYETGVGVHLGEGTAKVAAKFSSLREIHASVNLEQVDPDHWLTVLMGRNDLAALDTRIGGTIELDGSRETKIASASFKLAASPFRYGDLVVPEGQPFTAEGSASVTGRLHPLVEIPSLDIYVGDGASLKIANCSVPTESFNGQADIEGEFDLAFLAPLLSLEELRGLVNFTAPVRNEKGMLTAGLALTVENLGYGDFAAPYGTPLRVKGVVEYDNINDTGGVRDIEAALGDGTAFSCASWLVDVPSMHCEAPCTFRTDFQPFVAMGFLDSAEGTAKATGGLKYDDEGFSSAFELDARAESMVLAGELAKVNDGALKGTVGNTPDGSLTGTADFSAAALSVYKAVIRDIKGPVVFEGDAAKGTGLEGALYGGAIKADIEIGVLCSGLPVHLSAHIEGVDLEAFSREMAIPMLSLTGLADGDLALAFDLEGLEDVEFILSSTGEFSISRAVLEPLLRSHYAKQFGDEKRLERVMAKIVGKEERCPFDTAKLTLSLDEGRLGAQLVLVSETLDLTFDLGTDPGKLLEDLEMIIQGRLEEVAGVQS